MSLESLLPFDEEAAACRRKALAYVGRPEGPFLLRVAEEFDRLASEGAQLGRRRGDATGKPRQQG